MWRPARGGSSPRVSRSTRVLASVVATSWCAALAPSALSFVGLAQTSRRASVARGATTGSVKEWNTEWKENYAEKSDEELHTAIAETRKARFNIKMDEWRQKPEEGETDPRMDKLKYFYKRIRNTLKYRENCRLKEEAAQVKPKVLADTISEKQQDDAFLMFAQIGTRKYKKCHNWRHPDRARHIYEDQKQWYRDHEERLKDRYYSAEELLFGGNKYIKSVKKTFLQKAMKEKRTAMYEKNALNKALGQAFNTKLRVARLIKEREDKVAEREQIASKRRGRLPPSNEDLEAAGGE